MSFDKYTVQPTLHKHNPRLHGQIISTLRPNRVVMRHIAMALGIDPRNDAESVLTSRTFTDTAKAEQTYFAFRGGKAKRVDAASVVEAASVCGGKSHFAAKLRICPPRHAAVRDMMPNLLQYWKGKVRQLPIVYFHFHNNPTVLIDVDYMYLRILLGFNGF
ncbi:hypothetical protein DPMN_124179 [Dreissena polymorpha]|uniref:Uncharacterized protein n=1 Tax=Dreissena polymorpha TaxID=45954 RepID=A0A9D4GVW8_DREPO|nr:hypothetical protein DPMN_124179 [Dreissena polymorpha]